MSWAASRKTTREEDMAWCLLGIFDIEMPPSYVQRARDLPSKAFRNLQEQIMKTSDDHSILAWEQIPGGPTWTGALAPSPACFRNSGSIVGNTNMGQLHYSDSNRGVSIVLPTRATPDKGIILGGLDCSYQLYGGNSKHQFQVWIPLQHIRGLTFTRRHSPTSRILLDQTYEMAEAPVIQDILIVTTDPVRSQQQVDDAPKTTLSQNLMMESTGLIIASGWGETIVEGLVYAKAYLAQPLVTTPLRSRGRSAVSHCLVSNGTYTILLSVAWDLHNKAIGLFHTTLRDKHMYLHRRLAQQQYWNHLPSDDQGLEDSQKERQREIELIHDEIKGRYGNVTQQGELVPYISRCNQDIRDMNGSSQCLVTITFRNKPM